MQLSVIVPVYNAEKYLKACVDSILNQTISDYEIILVDDGAKDNSPAMCDEYAAKNSNVVVVHKPNGGITTARKAGLRVAKGEYIAYVDSDDWIEEDMYEIMLSPIAETDCDAVLCDIVYETGREQILQPNYIKSGLYSDKKLEEEFYPKMLFDYKNECPGINPSLCNKLIRRDILERVMYSVSEDIVFGEDALSSYPSLLDCDSVYVVGGKPLYHYRQNLTSVTNTYDEKLLFKFERLAKELTEQFDSRNFNPDKQLCGYTARYSLECIRNELLFHKKVSAAKRREIVKTYLNKPIIKKSFNVAIGEIKNGKTKTKMKLADKNRLVVLYLLFYFKNIVLKYQRRKYEN